MPLVDLGPAPTKKAGLVDLGPVDDTSNLTQALTNMDPEVAAKRTTSYILSKELGLSGNTIDATYSNVVKKVYGEPLKATEVQKRMEESGILANPKADQADIEEISKAMLAGFKQTPAESERQQRNHLIKQTAKAFDAIIQDEEDLFSGPTQWAADIAAKRDDPGRISSLPTYEDEDLLDIGTYKSLLEQTSTKQQVADLRAERKALVARLWNDTLKGQRDDFITKEMGKFTTGNKLDDVVLEGAKGLYGSLLSVERGMWGTALVIGTWSGTNQVPMLPRPL